MIDVQTLENRYVLHEQIGVGGMGVVLKAYDRLHDQWVAIKRLNLELSNAKETDDLRLALTREFQATAALQHPNIVQVLDYSFDEDRQPFLVMELLDNPQNIIKASLDRTPLEKLKMLVSVLHSLHYLHRRNMLHRDIKPDNIFMSGDTIKLVDFGLATVKNQQAVFAGTIAYMAPELLQEKPPSEASDLYALGVVAYEMLVGQHPFSNQQQSVVELINNILTTSPDLKPLIEMSKQEFFTTKKLDKHVTQADDQPTRVLDVSEIPSTENRTSEVVEILEDSTQDFHIKDVPGIIMRLLHADPQKRYNNAADVIHDLSIAIGEPLPVETPEIRESFLQAAQFVGREAELNQLMTALKKANAARGSVVFVGGESGVGKSRLAEELRIHALTLGTLVLRGNAAENGAAYQVWHDPFRRLMLNSQLGDTDAAIVEDIIPNSPSTHSAPDLEPEETVQRLSRTIASLIQQQGKPVLLILEDIHWATQESLSLLSMFSTFIAELPLLIVATFRDDEQNSALEPLLEDHPVIHLERFDERETSRLSMSIIGDRANQNGVINFLSKETEGNVFFIIEVLRALAEEAGQLEQVGRMTLPAQLFVGGVQRIVQRKLERVPHDARPLLNLAALMGRIIDEAVLQAAANGKNLADWLHTCEEYAILEVSDGQWHFAHDKLREGLLQHLSDADTRRAHLEAAQAIEQVYADQPQYSNMLADHWHHAGNAEKEIHFRQQAARYNYHIGNYLLAIRNYEQLLRLSQNGMHHTQLSKIYWKLGDRDRAEQYLTSAEAIAIEKTNAVLRAEVHLQRARFALAEGWLKQAEEHLDASHKLYTRLDNATGTAEINILLGEIYAATGRPEQAESKLTQALMEQRDLGNQRGLAHVLHMLGQLSAQRGDFEQAKTYLEESRIISKSLEQASSEAAILMELGMIAYYEQDEEAAEIYSRQSLEKFKDVQDLAGMAAVHNNLGFMAISSGNLERAEAELQHSLKLSKRIGDQWGYANTLANLAHIQTEKGEREGALNAYHESLDHAFQIGAVPLIMEVFNGIAQHLVEDDPPTAEALLRMVLAHDASGADVRQKSVTLFEQHFADTHQPVDTSRDAVFLLWDRVCQTNGMSKKSAM